jgi:hypothetical protein
MFQMTSDVDVVYTKVVALNIYNFVVDKFFIWYRLEAHIFIVWKKSKKLNFKIWEFKTNIWASKCPQ